MVEKPLATTREDADELVELALERERVLMCGHTFLFSPPVRKVRSYIESGELGEIYFISSSRVNLGLHQKDVSVLWDLGPHDFSILNHWLGKAPEAITTVGRDSIVDGVADVAFVSLSYESGLIANVELSWLSPSKLRRTVVVGSEKMVVYDDGAPEPIRLFDHGVVYSDPESFGEFQLAYRTGDILSPALTRKSRSRCSFAPSTRRSPRAERMRSTSGWRATSWRWWRRRRARSATAGVASRSKLGWRFDQHRGLRRA